MRSYQFALDMQANTADYIQTHALGQHSSLWTTQCTGRKQYYDSDHPEPLSVCLLLHQRLDKLLRKPQPKLALVLTLQPRRLAC